MDSLVVLCHLALLYCFTALGHIVERLEVLDSLVAFNVVAGSGNAPHGHDPVGGIVIVQTLRFQVLPNGLGRLAGIVPGHFVKEVVRHVRAANGVVENVKDAVGSVNGGERALDPGPFAFAVVRNGGIRVLQPSVEDEPGVGDSVGAPVPQEDGQVTEMVVCRVDESDNGGNLGHGAQPDLGRHLGIEHAGVGAKVIGEITIEWFSVVANLSGTGQTQQIHGPSNGQMRPDLKGSKGTFTHGFVPGSVEGMTFAFNESIVLGSAGNVRFAIHQVVGATVVFGVRVLPGKVGYQQRLVHQKAHTVIEGLTVGKGAVATLVTNHPWTREDGAHPKGIESPTCDPRHDGQGIGEIGKVGAQHEARAVRKGSRHGAVARQVKETPKVASLKAFFGNDGFDLALGGKLGRILVQWIVR